MENKKVSTTAQISCRVDIEVEQAIKREATLRDWSVSKTAAKILTRWAKDEKRDKTAP